MRSTTSRRALAHLGDGLGRDARARAAPPPCPRVASTRKPCVGELAHAVADRRRGPRRAPRRARVPARRAARCPPRSAPSRRRGRSRESMPITSPVHFISGPSRVSTPGNLTNGKTASLTEIVARPDLLGEAELRERLARPSPAPRASRAARPIALRHERHRARGARVHLEHVDGVVLRPRTARSSGPTTPSSSAERVACDSRIVVDDGRGERVRRQRAARSRPSGCPPPRCAP